MICCCSHFVGIHAQPAAPNEPPGKCAKEGCECGLFELDGEASMKPPVMESARPLGLCGCREITFRDGRQGRQNCAQHCYEELANTFQGLANLLNGAQVCFRRLAELDGQKTAARIERENQILLEGGGAAKGPRRIS